jgi:hypothetical protein
MRLAVLHRMIVASALHPTTVTFISHSGRLTEKKNIKLVVAFVMIYLPDLVWFEF